MENFRKHQPHIAFSEGTSAGGYGVRAGLPLDLDDATAEVHRHASEIRLIERLLQVLRILGWRTIAGRLNDQRSIRSVIDSARNLQREVGGTAAVAPKRALFDVTTPQSQRPM